MSPDLAACHGTGRQSGKNGLTIAAFGINIRIVMSR
jgi:hypothetical protein